MFELVGPPFPWRLRSGGETGRSSLCIWAGRPVTKIPPVPFQRSEARPWRSRKSVSS
jgi:hypothetical protein